MLITLLQSYISLSVFPPQIPPARSDSRTPQPTAPAPLPGKAPETHTARSLPACAPPGDESIPAHHLPAENRASQRLHLHRLQLARLHKQPQEVGLRPSDLLPSSHALFFCLPEKPLHPLDEPPRQINPGVDLLLSGLRHERVLV